MKEYRLTPGFTQEGRPILLLHAVRDLEPHFNRRWRWIGTWDVRDIYTAVAVRDDLNLLEADHGT